MFSKMIALLYLCLNFYFPSALSEDFSVIIIPDMHVDDLNNNAINQIRWIKDQRVNERILLVAGVGDYSTRGNLRASWDKVKQVWKPLFDLRGTTNDPFKFMAVSFALGNHDYDSYYSAPAGQPRGWNKTNATTYKNVFGKKNWTSYSWYSGIDYNDENHVQFIKADGFTIMHINLEWDIGNSSGKAVTGISDAETATRLAWLNSQLQRFAKFPTIITTHDYLSEAGTLSAAGKKIWNVIKNHRNVFLVNSGHVCSISNVPGTGSAHAVANRTGMGPVLQLLSDYQNFQRSRAWTRQLKLSGEANKKTITWTTFSVSSSPRVDLRDSRSTNSWKLNLSQYGSPNINGTDLQ